jgi:hypothetical protein
MRRWWLALLIALGLLLLLPLPSQASVHVYPETGSRQMTRSLQTLRDAQDQAWQVVLFKRTEGQQTLGIYLRLVGFPGQVLPHPQNLAVGYGTRRWQLADVFAQEPSLTANVGEYDAAPLLWELDGAPPLALTVGETLHLTVPPYVVREWQQVVANESGFAF